MTIALHWTVGRALIAAAVCVVSTGSTGALGDVRYVDDDAPPAGDGLSWSTAYRFLQDALTDARNSGGVVDEIRVGQGLYLPDRDEVNPNGTGDRTATFELVDGVQLLGGYAGFGAPDPDERDIDAYVTTLSGDLLGDDDPNEPAVGIDENAYHVVDASGTSDSTVLEGLTITSGYANGEEGLNQRHGAGVYNDGGDLVVRRCCFLTNKQHARDAWGAGMFNNGGQPTIEDCVFDGNIQLSSETRNGFCYGAGMYNYLSGATVTDCLFIRNSTNHTGGAMYNERGSVHVTGCSFVDNVAFYSFEGERAGQGGAIENYLGTPVISNCQFRNNLALRYGGAIHNVNAGSEVVDCVFEDNKVGMPPSFEGPGEGGAYRTVGLGQPVVRRCLFLRNLASQVGAGIHARRSTLTVEECTFIDGTAGAGGAISNSDGQISVRSCRFLGNHARSRGGALATYNADGVTELTNCLLIGNTSDGDAGALYLDTTAASSPVVNCALVQNVATESGGGAYVDHGVLDVTSSIVWNNEDQDGTGYFAQIDGSAVITYSCMTGITTGTGNIDDDPLFFDPDGPDDIIGTEDDDLHLRPGSPCIDAGDNTAVPPDITTDLDGNDRFIDDPDSPDTGNGQAPIVDMGPHEFTGVAERVCPDDPGAFIRMFGGEVNGTALDLCESDDVHLKVLQKAQLSPLLPFIRLETWANTTVPQGSIAGLVYQSEMRVSAVVPGGMNGDTLRTSIRNYGLGQFEQIDQRGTANPFADEVLIHAVSTGSDYVREGDGEIRIRYDCWNPGVVVFANWELLVDQYVIFVLNN